MANEKNIADLGRTCSFSISISGFYKLSSRRGALKYAKARERTESNCLCGELLTEENNNRKPIVRKALLYFTHSHEAYEPLRRQKR